MRPARILLATPAALLVIACSATEPNTMHPVSLSAAIAGGTTAGGNTRNLVVADQWGSVSISSAEMVLSRIELANNQSCARGSAANFSNQSDDDDASDTTDADDGEGDDDGEPSDTTATDNGDDDGEPSDTTATDNGDDDDDGEPSDTTATDDGDDDDDGEPSDTTATDDGDDDDDGEPSDTTEVDDDDEEESDTTATDTAVVVGPTVSCAPLQTGQVLVNLPLDGTTKGIADAFVPAGTYTRLQANVRTVKVVGVYTDANGTAHQFTLTPRLNVVRAITLDGPVTVDASAINLILDVGVRSWFTDRSGAVLDPTRAANQRVVERNILRSLRARS